MKTLFALVALSSLASANGEFAARVAAAAGRALPATLAVVEARPPRSLSPSQNPRVEWRIAPHAGEISVWVVSGKSSAWVPVKVAPVRRVIVAARGLASGQTIDADDLRLAAAPIVDGNPISADPSTLIGSVVNSDIAEGAVVSAADLTRPPPIARGSSVRVEIRSGNMLVSAIGTLERDARPGDTVNARLPSMHSVRGRLIDAHTLEVMQ